MQTQSTPGFPPSGQPFKGLILNTDSAEELERQSEELIEKAAQLRARERVSKLAQESQERDGDMKRLLDLRAEYRKLEIAGQGYLDLKDSLLLIDKREVIQLEIEAIEAKYSIGKVTEQDEITERSKKQSSIWPTVAGIVALLVVCWGSVVYSGNWILDRYPGAAIYNAVSFQKVVFGFSVFIAEVAGAIIATAIFFPGIGKYFNPFNREQLDFYTDFKKLTEWQRSLISLFLFVALLLAFVLTVSGKLD